ncbi:Haloacid dehalogenase-like hydrolase family protein [[Clostridium] ultunense Esp]|nr:Haloacid dehalogenase-like hydrolase family protein [[Clostridium] ultunense Esp]
MPIKAILFDLDGTLLPIDTDQFVAGYIRTLSEYVSHLVDPALFVKQLFASTAAMIWNRDPGKTNKDVFDEDFYPKVGNGEALIPLVDLFYAEEFPKLSAIVHPHPFTSDLIRTVKERGYRTAVATNPLFPKSAIEQRILWTGARPEQFEWITTYENSHFTKPNVEYYEELIERLKLPPEETLMVGNDVQEDMVAKEIGLKTYLVTDKKIDRGEPSYLPDGEGRLWDFYQDLLWGRGIFAEV